MSIFKKNPHLIILSVLFRLEKGDSKVSRGIKNDILKQRQEKHPLEFPSAGCVFENVVARKEDFEKFPLELQRFKEAGVIPAGFLIDQCGLKGKIIGQAQISEKHANFIINLGEASSADIFSLKELAKEKVRERYGIELREEIECLR